MKCLQGVMQKLLRTTSSAPILYTVGSAHSLVFNKLQTHKFPLSLHTNYVKDFHFIASFNTLSLCLSRLSTMAASAFSNTATSSLASSITKKPLTAMSCRSCRICRCVIDNSAQSRAWVVLKDVRNGSRAAWLHSDSDGSIVGKKTSENAFGESNGDDGIMESSGEKPLRLHRKQKGSSSITGVPSNPDLLTIPGVGPRNLRKLVENGIAGVAELKQLYKDKVCDS